MEHQSDTAAADRQPDDGHRDPGAKYEYLDHTADVQIHAWGDSLSEAFENCAVGMFGYMTDLETVQESETITIEVQADDIETLLYQFLDEFLFTFSADPFMVCKRVRIDEFDLEAKRIKATGFGEPFDLDRHPQGTEVKAITYSNMQVLDKQVFVIIDI
jgi:SHS2 domain-containing protein